MKLIVAEKRSVAEIIAPVVGANEKCQGYYKGNGYYVGYCRGHLVGLAPPDAYGEQYKKWDMATLPIIPTQYKTEITKFGENEYAVLHKLMLQNDVEEIIEATDAGREGELIFRLVYEKIGCTKPFSRLWVSSLEEKSIAEGIKNTKPSKEYDNLYAASYCRQRADWLLGMNLTRLYTTMYNKKLNTGRVQTPTLNLVVMRQQDITNFISVPYYRISALFQGFEATTKVDNKAQAQAIFAKISGKEATVVKVEKETKKQHAPRLYDSTQLLREANRYLGYSAKQTLDYAQKLYDEKLTTYPRTESQYISEDMEQTAHLLINKLLTISIYDERMTANYNLEEVNIKQVINNAKVSDHPALTPTLSVTPEKIAALSTGERNVFLLIAYRFAAALYSDHVADNTKVYFDIENETFTCAGTSVKEEGFKLVEKYAAAHIYSDKKQSSDIEETTLPQMAEGNTFSVIDTKLEEKETQPPKPYTEDTLLSAMKTAGKHIEDEELAETMKGCSLGTAATRAGILENLVLCGYITRVGKALLPTEIGSTFISLAAEEIKSPELTAAWEHKLLMIESGELTPTVFLNELTTFISSFVEGIKMFYDKDASGQIFSNNQEHTTIGECPKCGQSIREVNVGYACVAGKEKCGFFIGKKILGKDISPAQVSKLLSKKKTDLIKGFKSSAGKSFDAFLTLKEDFTIGFEFAPYATKR